MESTRIGRSVLLVLAFVAGCGDGETDGSGGGGAGNTGSGASATAGTGTGAGTQGGGGTGGAEDPCADVVCTPPAICEIQGAQGVCVCPAGYTLQGNGCVDVDECAGGGVCPEGAQCENLPGSYACTCSPGSIWDGVLCQPKGNRRLDAGDRQICRIEDSGVIACWGYLRQGQADTPTWRTAQPVVVNPDTDWISVVVAGGSIDDYHVRTCGLKESGSLWCWGDPLFINGGPFNDSPVPETPGIVWSTVGVGVLRTCGIQIDGTLWCWGVNVGEELGVPGGVLVTAPAQVGADSDWAMLATGNFHNCAIKKNGDLYCWGSNNGGRLGTGTNDDATQPTYVGSNFSVVGLSGSHSCGVKTNGTLWCWGLNYGGELGVGDGTDSVLSPVQVGGSGDWRDVEVGDGYSCASKQDGSLWCWGTLGGPKHDQEGSPLVVSFTPVKVGLPSGVARAAISSLAFNGGDFACAVGVDGQTTCWGANIHGEAGGGVFGSQDMPMQVGADQWAAIDTELSQTCGVRANGTLWCWGSTPNGFALREVPEQMGSDAGWKTVGVGEHYACALRDDGTLWCWGEASTGELGLGENVLFTPEPMQVGFATDWDTLAVGFVHNCAIRANGDLYCWGRNDDGQIGAGNATWQYDPIQVEPGVAWKAVAAGKGTCAISDTGALYCWGVKGGTPMVTQVGVETDWTAIAVGRNPWVGGPAAPRTCGIRAPGTLWCWGDGPLGDGTTNSSATPLQIGADTDWATVSINHETVCATKTDHRLFCWGVDVGAEALGWSRTDLVPTQIGSAEFETVHVGDMEACAKKTDGTIACWGDDREGQLGTGDGFFDSLVTVLP